MSTVYKHLNHYVTQIEKKRNLKPLTQMQRLELGIMISDKWRSVNMQRDLESKPFICIMKISSIEDGVEYKVNSYPKFFIPIIVETIAAYYESLIPVKRERKRIPVRNAKVELRF